MTAEEMQRLLAEREAAAAETTSTTTAATASHSKSINQKNQSSKADSKSHSHSKSPKQHKKLTTAARVRLQKRAAKKGVYVHRNRSGEQQKPHQFNAAQRMMKRSEEVRAKRQAERNVIEKERQTRDRKRKEAQKRRKQTRARYEKRTKRGQLVMKGVVENILDKLQRQANQ
jgi:hypothetical protein